MLFHEVIEGATKDDIGMYIALRNMNASEQRRASNRQALRSNMP